MSSDEYLEMSCCHTYQPQLVENVRETMLWTTLCNASNTHQPEPQLKSSSRSFAILSHNSRDPILSHNSRNATYLTPILSHNNSKDAFRAITQGTPRYTRAARRNTLLDHLALGTCRQAPRASVDIACSYRLAKRPSLLSAIRSRAPLIW
ncbi:hypothetical protein DEO72_LG10g1584 [Vigna unguiculata]|uniref:Uncharacterized protein n=1 Tax=Vigna unguiculata TaxID=3917 RepID=A0A4D6NC70_VIGUN|nr:hypothetical protein DEO72_LG10g1584 [Vigna unguiculata]